MKSLDQDSLLMTGSWTSSWSATEAEWGAVGLVWRDGGWDSCFGVPLVLGGGDLLGVGDAGAVVSLGCFVSGLVLGGCVVASSKLPGIGLMLSPLLVLSVVGVVGIFGLKKPFRLCCPFPVDIPFAVVETDLDRLRGRLVDVSPRDRLLLTLFAGLAGGIGEAGWEDGCGGREGAVAIEVATCGSTISCRTVEGNWEISVNSLSRLCAVVDDWVLCAVGREGLRENISLIFLRRSNSGINLPDSGSRSFIEYSRNRFPCLNMPAGFVTSRTSTSSPFSKILSFSVAYTGQ